MVEEQRYNVIKKVDNLEIRKYPEMILALVKGFDDRDAFSILFNFISGNNTFKEKIEMTAPVLNSHKIEMTTPVVSSDDFFAFIMPSNYNKDTIPVPNDKRIDIEFEPEKTMAVIKANGYLIKRKIDKYQQILFEQLKKNKIQIKGSPIIMRYNSPFTPPFMRKNEIGVVVVFE